MKRTMKHAMDRLALGGLLLGLAGTAQAAEIRFGMAAPMTGQYAAFGEQLRAGVRMGLDDLNAQGGLLGRTVVLEVGDDACDPRQAVNVANRMVQRNVTFLFGHFCSGSTLAAGDLYAEERIPVATVSTNPQITERGWNNLVRLSYRDDQQGAVIGAHILKSFPQARIALVNDKSSFGKGLVEEARKALGAGAVIVADEAVNAGERDYAALVSRLRQSGAEVVFFGGYHTEAGLILRQMREAGLTMRMVAGDPMASSELWSIAGTAAEGLLFTFPPDPRTLPSARPVVERLRQKGVEPEGWVVFGYAAVQLFADAVRKAGGTDKARLAEAMRGGSFDTALGRLAFDAKGDNRSGGLVVYRWSEGRYEPVGN